MLHQQPDNGLRFPARNFHDPFSHLHEWHEREIQVAMPLIIISPPVKYDEFACTNYQSLTKVLFVLFMFLMVCRVLQSQQILLLANHDDQHSDRNDGQHLC